MGKSANLCSEAFPTPLPRVCREVTCSHFYSFLQTMCVQCWPRHTTIIHGCHPFHVLGFVFLLTT